MRLQPYPAHPSNSGVTAYAAGPGWIVLEFRDGRRYRYDARAPGLRHVMEMQRLAAAGKGLATYVNREVRGDYAARLQ